MPYDGDTLIQGSPAMARLSENVHGTDQSEVTILATGTGKRSPIGGVVLGDSRAGQRSILELAPPILFPELFPDPLIPELFPETVSINPCDL